MASQFRYRRRRRELTFRTSRVQRSIPGPRNLYRVEWEPKDLPIFDWIRAKALKDPEPGPNWLWTRSRIFANSAARRIHDRGGTVEIHDMPAMNCPICGRWLLGVDADTQFEVNQRAGVPQICAFDCDKLEPRELRRLAKLAQDW